MKPMLMSLRVNEAVYAWRGGDCFTAFAMTFMEEILNTVRLKTVSAVSQDGRSWQGFATKLRRSGARRGGCLR
jgi:hypothetical protein